MAHMTKKKLAMKERNNLNRGYSNLEVKYVGSMTHRNPKTDYRRIKLNATTGKAYEKYV